MDSLPLELLFHIIHFIDTPNDLLSLGRANKLFRRLLRDELVWKQKCFLRWPTRVTRTFANYAKFVQSWSWLETFRRQYIESLHWDKGEYDISLSMTMRLGYITLFHVHKDTQTPETKDNHLKLAVATSSTCVYVYDLSTKKHLRTLKMNTNAAPAYFVNACDAGQSFMVTARLDRLNLWDMKRLKRVHMHTIHDLRKIETPSMLGNVDVDNTYAVFYATSHQLYFLNAEFQCHAALHDMPETPMVIPRMVSLRDYGLLGIDCGGKVCLFDWRRTPSPVCAVEYERVPFLTGLLEAGGPLAPVDMITCSSGLKRWDLRNPRQWVYEQPLENRPTSLLLDRDTARLLWVEDHIIVVSREDVRRAKAEIMYTVDGRWGMSIAHMDYINKGLVVQGKAGVNNHVVRLDFLAGRRN